MPFQYHQATETDINTLVEFTNQIHQHEDDGQIPTHQHFIENLQKWLISEINNSQSLIIIASQAQQTVGFILASTVVNDNGFLEYPLKGIIQLLWVEPQFRRSAVADALVSQVEVCFQENQIPYIECSYTANNEIGANFWTNKAYLKTSITARKIL